MVPISLPKLSRLALSQFNNAEHPPTIQSRQDTHYTRKLSHQIQGRSIRLNRYFEPINGTQFLLKGYQQHRQALLPQGLPTTRLRHLRKIPCLHPSQLHKKDRRPLSLSGMPNREVPHRLRVFTIGWMISVIKTLDPMPLWSMLKGRHVWPLVCRIALAPAFEDICARLRIDHGQGSFSLNNLSNNP
jgi:hypothetical protein